MAGPVSAQWTLSQTVADGVSISRGLIEAATSDNVQVIALLACERFGATLPMTPESCAKAHQLCSQAHETTVLTFLKVKIGFRKGDSGWQLSRSDAGLRFLAFAACLLSIDWWDAAEALRSMIKDTAADKTLVPTSHQLKGLLKALNPRLACSGFADSVLGWSIWLRTTSQQPSIETFTPSPKTVIAVIQALSSAARIGQTRSVHITIDVNEASWIIALIKWCIGAPPIVIFPNEITILEQEDSQVFLHPTLGTKLDATVTSKDSLGDITQLISDLPTCSELPLYGMVRVAIFASELLESLGGPKDGNRYRVGKEAIAYGCYAFFKCWCTPITAIQEAESVGISASYGWPFPTMEGLIKILATFVGVDQASKIPELPQGILVEDHPFLQEVKTQICSQCPCKSCTDLTTRSQRSCDFDEYMDAISLCVTYVYLVSLYIPLTPDGVFVYYNGTRRNILAFRDLISNCLRSKRATRCFTATDADKILMAAIDLVGGGFSREKPRESYRLMACAHGQTIYPEALGSLTLQQSGMMRLRCVPGVIQFKGETYNSVERGWYEFDSFIADSAGATDEQRPLSTLPKQYVPQDNYANSHITWRISRMESWLEIALTIRDIRGDPSRDPISPVEEAIDSLFVNCPHNRADTVTDARNCFITGPLQPHPRPLGLTDIGVVPTDRNESMRYFSLASNGRCVVRQEACIQCCIHVCRLSGLNVLIC